MIEYKIVKYKGRKDDSKFVDFLNKQGMDDWELYSAVEKKEHASSKDVLGIAYPNRTYTIVECQFKRKL